MRNFKLLSLLLSILLLVLLLFGEGCFDNTKTNGCDNSINDWSHFITKDLAKRYIDSLKARRALNPRVHALDSTQIGTAELFIHARDMMRNMMLRDTCVGMRVYYGLKEGRIIPIVCGAKADKGDIYWEMPSNLKAKGLAAPLPTQGLLDLSQGEPPVMAIPTLH